MNGNSRRRHKVKGFKGKNGILLDIGCGETWRPGYVRLDKDSRVKPDILHDLEVFPYPLKDEVCLSIVACHIVEHIKPWLMIDFMNELWRVSKFDCQFAIKVPYGVNSSFIQDPTHCNPCNETTWQYFDPRYKTVYDKYKPKPWKIEFASYQANGNMEVLLRKIHPETTSEVLKKVESESSSVSRRQV